MRFAGYAAVFDRPDKGGDIVRKGAFLRALERAHEVPLLWQQVGAASFLSDAEKRDMLGFKEKPE